MMKTNNGNLLGASCTWTVGLVCALFLTINAPAAEQEPDNAAILYYQAFLLCPDRDDIPDEVRFVVRSPSGADVAELRKHTKGYQHVIQLLEAASKMPYCNLAVPRSPRGIAGDIHQKLTRHTKSAAVLIGANVRVLAADGDYRTALSQSLMLRRIAWHIADDHPLDFSSLVLITADRAGLRCVRSVLEVMPPDEKTLTWLSGQLAEAPRLSDVTLPRAKYHLEHWLPALREHGAITFSVLRKRLAKKSTNEAQKKQALALTDDELLELVRVPFEKLRQSVLDALSSDMSYEQRDARLQSLEKGNWGQQRNNPAIVLPLLLAVDGIVNDYYIQVANTRWCNAYEAAVEIYLLKATTGRLPETLPDGLPKDPLTSKKFLYKVTADGFVLDRPAKYSKWPKFEFRVRQ